MNLIALWNRSLIPASILVFVCTTARADQQQNDDLKGVPGVVVKVSLNAPKDAHLGPNADTILKSFSEKHLRTAGVKTFSTLPKAVPGLPGPLIVEIDAQELHSITAYDIRIGFYLPAFRISGEYLTVVR